MRNEYIGYMAHLSLVKQSISSEIAVKIIQILTVTNFIYQNRRGNSLLSAETSTIIVIFTAESL